MDLFNVHTCFQSNPPDVNKKIAQKLSIGFDDELSRSDSPPRRDFPQRSMSWMGAPRSICVPSLSPDMHRDPSPELPSIR